MISIKTRLNDGIYKSCGGGEVVTHYEWKTGPRNLMSAINTYNEHCNSMLRAYGNVGCGSSWIEIDGIRIDWYELDCEFDTEIGNSRRITKTQFYKNVIESVTNGKLIAQREADALFKQQLHDAFNAGQQAAINGNKKPVFDDILMQQKCDDGFSSVVDYQ